MGFGEADPGTWGVAWFPQAGAGAEAVDGSLALAAGGDAIELPARLRLQDLDGAWQVEAEGAQITVSPLGLPAPEAAANGSPPAREWLVRAEGEFVLGGQRHELGCLGWRASREHLLEEDWGSLHQVAAWFTEDHGLTLTALHPPGARTHEEARVTAAVLGSEACAVEDPRLSSTYRTDGELLRAGIELWLARGEADELYPLRASGEAAGPGFSWERDGISVAAQPVRWHSRDRDGSGIYLRGRR